MGLYRAKDFWTGTLASSIPDGTVTSFTLSSSSGLTNGETYVFTIDRVDANGTKTLNKKEAIVGTVSGSNVINCQRGAEGTAQSHSAGAIVEILFTAKHWNDLIDSYKTQHREDGTHSKIKGLDNNQPITQKDSGGTARDIANINSSDVTTFGNTTTTTKIKAGSNTTSGHTVPNVADDTFALLSNPSQNIKLPTPFSTATDGATVTFDLAQSRNWIVTLGGNRTLALSNVLTGMVFMITLKQDGTGSRTVTWWSGISWAGGIAPTLTTTANKADTFGFICTGTNTYYGYVVGQNL
jgi:hypothetical protein